MNRTIFIVIIGLLLGIVMATSSCVISRSQAQADEAQFLHRMEQQKRLALEEDNLALTAKSQEQANENVQLADKVALLQRRLANRPVPAPPSPVPNTDPEITDGLMRAGFAPGLKVSEEAPASTMFRMDAKLAWTWKEDAARVPGLEAHIASRVDLEKGMSDEIGGLKKEIKIQKDIAKVDFSIKQSQATEIATLGQATKAAQTEAKAQYVKGWAKALAALAIGYGVGRAR